MAVTVILLSGCSNSSPPAVSEKNNSREMQPARTEQQETTMVARVNGVTIAAAEVEDELNNFIAQYRDKVPPETLQKMRPTLQQQALDKLINTELLMQEAGRTNVKPTEKEIEAEVDELKNRFPSPEAFQQRLADIGVTDQNLRDDIIKQLKITSVVETVVENVPSAEDAAIKDYYDSNPDDFLVPEKVRASHILCMIKQDDSQKAKEIKRKKIELLKTQIDNGADFAEIAQEHSECPSGKQGGDLGFFERGKMVKPFEDAAFSLKTGEVSDIVETPFGYHLIKVFDRMPEKTLSFDNASDKIADYLNEQKKNEAINSFIQQLREKAKIDYADSTQN